MPPTLAQKACLPAWIGIFGRQRQQGSLAIDQAQLAHVAAKAAIDVMVLAKHIGGDGPSHGDVAGAGGNRQEEACRHDHPEDLIEACPLLR